MSNIPLSQRFNYLGASEIASLFYDVGAFRTLREIFEEKKSKCSPLEDSFIMRKGNFIESFIAHEAKTQFGLKLQKENNYIICDQFEKLGCSLDYYIDNDGEKIPVEIKNVDFMSCEWQFDEDNKSILVSVPMKYVLQIQCQMLCTGAQNAILIAATRTGLHLYRAKRHDGICEEIVRRAKYFWECVEKDEYPTFPDMPNMQIKEGGHEMLDEDLDLAIQKMKEIGEQISVLEKEKDAIHKRVKEKLPDYKKIVTGKYIITQSVIPAKKMEFWREESKRVNYKAKNEVENAQD